MSPKRLLDTVFVGALAILGLSLAADGLEAESTAERTGQADAPAAPRRAAASGPLGRAMAPSARGGAPALGALSRAAATGANADRPSDIPARGWWQIIKRVVTEIGDDRVMAEAAGVTFYALLAIFPAIASLISLYGLIADPATIGQHLSMASGVVPDGGMQIISEQVKSLTSTPHKALGLGALVGILTSLWSANAGMKALMDALNAVYSEKETRSFVRRTLVSFAFTLGALAFISLAITGVVVLPAVLNFIGIGSTADAILGLARWPVMLAAIAFLLAFLYRYGPSRAQARWRWLSWGSTFAALTWLAASAGFSWYVANFGSYNRTYGSLGAAVGFMTWIWISTIIVLIGAELNAEMENQTTRDTTVKE